MKISIILTCYNIDERLFNRCINSIEKQTIGFDNIELIIVDDCSTVNSNILIEYCNKYNNVIYCNTNINSGPGAARNMGFNYVSSKYFMYMDYDDYYCNDDVLYNIYNIMISSNPDMLCGTFNTYIDKIPHNTHKLYTNKNDCKYILSRPPYLPSKCWRTDFIKENKLSNRRYRNSQDAIFMLETFIAANKIVVYNYIFIQYEIHTTSVTNIKTVDSLITRLTAKLEFDTIAKKHGYTNFSTLTFNMQWLMFDIISKTYIPEDRKKEVNELINKIYSIERNG